MINRYLLFGVSILCLAPVDALTQRTTYGVTVEVRNEAALSKVTTYAYVPGQPSFDKTLDQHIVSATRHPAEFFGLQDSLGTVEKGKLADLVLLDADPLAQIGNTQRIAGVVVAGRFMPKAELRKMLKRVEDAARRTNKR